jgi:hypothetical protein
VPDASIGFEMARSCRRGEIEASRMDVAGSLELRNGSTWLTYFRMLSEPVIDGG